MKTLTEPLINCQQYKNLQEQIVNHKFPALVTGCIDSQKSHFMSTVSAEYPYKVIITYNDIKVKEIYEDYKFFDKSVYVYPAKDVLFYSADIHGNAIVRQRLEIIKRLVEKKPTTIILTLDAILDQIPKLSEIKKNVIKFKVGDRLDLEEIRTRFVELGYESNSLVDGAGQYAIRGGIIDIYPITDECPYRIELWDDEIDSIRSFDVESQRSIESIKSLKVYPATEIVLSRDRIEKGLKLIEEEKNEYAVKLKNEFKTEAYARINKSIAQVKEELTEFNASIGVDSLIRFFYDEVVSFIDYFDTDKTMFFIDEPNRVMEKGEAYQTEFRESMIGRLEGGYILPQQAEVIFDYKGILARLSNYKTILISMLIHNLDFFNPTGHYDLDVKAVPSYNNSFEELVKDINSWKKKQYKIILLSPSKTRASRIADDLRNNEIECFYGDSLDRDLVPGELMVASGRLKKGFEYPLLKFVVISEGDIFNSKEKRTHRKKNSEYKGTKINNFSDITIGDYVVHEKHGLGIYKGIEKIEVDKITKDYINIEYKGGSNLFILASQLDMIQKYSSHDGRRPKLNKLGGSEWQKTKSKVRGQVKEVAQQLVDLYAIRQAKQGYAYSKDTVWQREFEEMFPYDETQDQLSAIEATKEDMESTKIMDRLICGDVGYGKTEVAIRAAFKAVGDGKQVVYLVPTTILAQQHYNSFVERMKEFPVTISMLSRFITPTQQKKTIEQLKKGQVDIVIGTHRVLSKDIQYKNLGLLIIDEEQRFGVAHKEKIKQMKKDIDVLALSATPIPRTLHMSLIGIRDMSVLEEPPVDRHAIQTYVLEYNSELVREAVNRELARGGQVYYVYNRVNNIDEITSEIAKLVPEASVAYAHGQMSERELEKIMLAFINGEIDVLVSTTIIETGLDIPNVNTMIIHDANHLGLSQLYQLRGRVGRSNRRAYAFLMYKRDTMLKETAEKRLQAIREFTDLGSGFKIAMRDLEIRGAGNLLGEDQSGHMAAVGYDLYCKMLNDAVSRLKGENVIDDEFETTIEIMIDAYIPATYVKNEFQKLELYKRIAGIESEEEYEDMLDELTDRFGDMPQAVINLIRIALIKAMAHKASIIEISEKNKVLYLKMYPQAKVDVDKIDSLLKKYRNKMKFIVEEVPQFKLQIDKEPRKELLKLIESVINDISNLIEGK